MGIAITALPALPQAAAVPNGKAGRVGSHFTLRIPDSWSFQGGATGGVLQPPDDTPGRGSGLRVLHIRSLYLPSDEQEVLRAVAGQLPNFLQKRLSHKKRNLGRTGAWMHSWELRSDSTAVMRIIVVPLPGNTAAAITGMYPEEVFRRWERDLESVAGSIGPPLDSPSGSSLADRSHPRSAQVPLVTGRGAAATPWETTALAQTAEELDQIRREWTGRLSGKTWASTERAFRLKYGGECEYEWIAASGRKTKGTGNWKVSMLEGSPHLAITSQDGRTTLFLCEIRGLAVLIDGETVKPL